MNEPDGSREELVEQVKDLAAKLLYVLRDVETEEGLYTFPDGDSWPAGLRKS